MCYTTNSTGRLVAQETAPGRSVT